MRTQTQTQTQTLTTIAQAIRATGLGHATGAQIRAACGVSDASIIAALESDAGWEQFVQMNCDNPRERGLALSATPACPQGVVRVYLR